MKISVLSIAPETFSGFRETPVISRAVGRGAITFECIDIRDYAQGSFRKIDDSPYGGGRGMILRVDTVFRTLEAVRGPSSRVVMLSPKGQQFTQKKAREYSKLDHIVLLCGHYEGFDERIRRYVDEEISIGDYILTGGELPAMIVCDSVVRLLDGSLREGSADDESFETGLLEYPQYTPPFEFNGDKVPEILLSGNHEAIDRWRHEKALEETKRLRPDLLVENL